MLKPTKKVTRPRRVIFFATQTWQAQISDKKTRHTLRHGHAHFYRYKELDGLQPYRDITFWNEPDFWSWVDKQATKKTTTYLVSYNAVFDLTVTAAFERLAGLGWSLDGMYSKDAVSVFRWSNGGRKLIALSMTNFFNESLEKIAASLGQVPVTEDLELSQEERLIEECKGNVKTLAAAWESWLAFLDEHNLGSFKWTAGSTAFSAWRHRFQSVNLHIHDDSSAIKLERDSYKGGRNECLFVGTRENDAFYYLDVNSMYGYILATKEFPGGIWGSNEGGSLYQLGYKLARYACIAKVTVGVTDNVFPMKYDQFSCYPLGEFTTTLTTPELKIALESGWIKEVHALAWYRKHKLFENYAQYFRSIREQFDAADNRVYSKIAKTMTNALYGKFGQYALKQKHVGTCDPKEFRREQIYDFGDQSYYDWVWLGGNIIKERHDGEGYNSFPAIAAHVTAYARIYLYWFMKQVPAGHLFYVDTDSMIVDQKGFDALKFYIDASAMGMLGIEKVSPWLMINAPKDYAMLGRSRKKGIPADAAQYKQDHFEFDLQPGLAGVIDGKMSGEYVTTRQTRRRLRGIFSGELGPDGWVRPFVFGGLEPVGSVPLYQHQQQRQSHE